jgi:MoaA/NifB/PqqE/SkfB family radical SAM enzyme
MELHVIKKLLDMYPTLRYFTLAGFGEPTLCPKFPDIVDFLRENHKYVGIISNGSNIGPFRRLKSIPNSISISLYGSDSASYINNTGCDMFEDVISNFRQLKSRFENVGFSFTITKTNYLELEKILCLCDKLEPEFFDLQNCLPYGSGNIQQTMNTITQEDKEIIQYIDQVSANRKYIRQNPIYIDLNHPKFSCRSHNYIINLDGDGNIGGCQRQIPPDPVFGNIFSDVNPFRSQKMEEIRKRIKKE